MTYTYGPPYMAKQKQDDLLEHTYNSYVRIRDVALKTSQRRWTIGRSGERGSGISVLAARHDDDDDDSYGLPPMAGQKQDDLLEHTYNSDVRIRDVALKTSQRRWTIGSSGERGSGIFVLAARHDDDDDDDEKPSMMTLTTKNNNAYRNYYNSMA